VRERLVRLLDKESPFFEIGLWLLTNDEQWGKIPAAESAGIGNVEGVPCMIVLTTPP
jgi:acetyl-CoA carboxylase carboxyltransferase component